MGKDDFIEIMASNMTEEQALRKEVEELKRKNAMFLKDIQTVDSVLGILKTAKIVTKEQIDAAFTLADRS